MDLGVKACRICLNTDVKMVYINNIMENDIKSIMGSNESSGVLLPKYICHECVFLLAKFIKFRKKYIIAQAILCDMLKTSNKITEQDIKKINRHAMKLKSDLSHHKLLPTSLTEEIYMTLEMTVDEDTSPFEVKPEVEVKLDVEEIKTDDNRFDAVDDGLVIADVTSPAEEWDEDDLPLKKIICKKNRKRNDIKKPDKKKYNRKKKENPNTTPKADSDVNSKEQNEDESLKDYTIIQLSMSEQLAELEKRKETSNYKDAPFKCDLCYKGFLLEETLRNHAVKHEPSSGDIVCAVCKFRFTKRCILNHHAVKHAKKFACNKCDFVAMFRDQIKKHLQWHDGVLYKCQYCNEVSTKKTSHLSHLRIKHPSQFVCDVCGYSYISALGLKQHKSKMHKHTPLQKETNGAKDNKSEEKQSSRYCKECDVMFMSEEAWRRHMVTSAKHTEHLGTSCRDCGGSFPSACELRAHTRTHEAARRRARTALARLRMPARAGYPRTCEHCPETLSSRMRHWKHYQRCHKDKKYPLGDKRFVCEYCGKKFYRNCLLVRHALGSCSARAVSAPLQCAHCTHRATTKLDLQQHVLKSHPSVRSFPCVLCGKVFWRALYLAQHETRCKAANKKAAS